MASLAEPADVQRLGVVDFPVAAFTPVPGALGLTPKCAALSTTWAMRSGEASIFVDSASPTGDPAPSFVWQSLVPLVWAYERLELTLKRRLELTSANGLCREQLIGRGVKCKHLPVPARELPIT